MKSAINKIRNFLLNDGVNSRLFQVFALLIAFFIPFVLAVMLFTANNYYPFVKDGHSLMMIDMSGQYIAFFRYYKAILDGNYDLFYTLGKVTGGEFISIFLYYLASPFNLLLKFYSLAELPAALMWIVILKIATAGLTSYIVLCKTNNNGYKNLIFSVSYALIAYSFVYYSNIMWLDGVYLLPFVALGIIKITKDESPLLYILSLAFVIVTSWYVGIMIAIFSVLFFFTQFNHYFSVWSKDKWRIVSFALSSLIAGVISFAFWGTALFTILGTKGGSSFTNISETLFEYFDYAAIQKGFFLHSFAGFADISGTATTVSFYIGVLPMILTILYFFKKDVEYKQKAGVLFIFAIYLFAFNNKGLNHLFHGGPSPNWFPGRFVFIFGFLLVFYGAETLSSFDKTHSAGFIAPPVMAFLLFLTIKTDEYKLKDTAYIYFIVSLVLLLCYYLLLRFVRDNEKVSANKKLLLTYKLLSTTTILALLVIALLNVYGNNNHILNSYNEPTNRHKDYSVYLKDEALSTGINFIKKYDGGVYRTEKSFIRSGTYNNADNDALYYGYNGISHYSSNEKQSTNKYMTKLGFHYNGFNLNYASGSTLAVNSYLGIKYLIDNGNNRNFDLTRYLDPLTYQNDDFTIYENIYALPLLFSTTKQNVTHIGEGHYINDNEIYWYDKFEYQNNIFKNMTNNVIDEHGNKKDIFKKLTYSQTLIGIEETSDANHYKVNNNGSITYKVIMPYSQNYYYYFNAKSIKHDSAPTITLRENGRNVNYFSYHGHQINSLVWTSVASTLVVSVSGKSDDVEIKPEFYYEDRAVLEEYVNAVKSEAVVTNFRALKSSKYAASIETFNDDQAMLLTLPYDSNLKVFVDGKQIKTTANFNIYTGFTIKKSGSHNIIIVYEQPSFQIGLPLGIFVFGATIFAHFKFKYLFIKKED